MLDNLRRILPAPPALASLLFAQLVSSLNCSIPPIYVDIHARPVHGSSALQWGSQIGVGSPVQHQSLWPSLSQDQTSVASVTYCERSQLRDCGNSTQGTFDISASTSWNQHRDFEDPDTIQTFSKGISGSDIVSLFTHSPNYFEKDIPIPTTVKSTLSVATAGNGDPGVVGLGLNSTILQSLFNEGRIPAKTIGIYTGTSMPRAGGNVNGSITFGGYDRGRFLDDVHTYGFDTANVIGLSLKVTDIIISTSDNKTTTSPFDQHHFANTSGLTYFEARLSSDQYPVTLPYQLTQNFKSLLSAHSASPSDGTLTLPDGFNGTMTFVLSDGFRITLPQNILSNNQITPVQDREANDTSSSYLGLSFLSQLYLMLDYDASKFHLATAVQHNAYVMPTPFCAGDIPRAYVAPRHDNFAEQGLTGAIIGGAIAGTVLMLVALWALVACLQFRKQDEAEESRERRTGKNLRLKIRIAGFQTMREGFEDEREGVPLMDKGSRWRRLPLLRRS